MFPTLDPSEDDIRVFISKLVAGDVSDAQLGAWLMATCIHGLNVQVTHHHHSVITHHINNPLTPGDGLADQGHGGEWCESGVARGVE